MEVWGPMLTVHDEAQAALVDIDECLVKVADLLHDFPGDVHALGVADELLDKRLTLRGT